MPGRVAPISAGRCGSRCVPVRRARFWHTCHEPPNNPRSGFGRRSVDPLAQRLARPEVRCVPCGKRHRSPGLRIAGDPASTEMQREAAEPRISMRPPEARHAVMCSSITFTARSTSCLASGDCMCAMRSTSSDFVIGPLSHTDPSPHGALACVPAAPGRIARVPSVHPARCGVRHERYRSRCLAGFRPMHTPEHGRSWVPVSELRRWPRKWQPRRTPAHAPRQCEPPLLRHCS